MKIKHEKIFPKKERHKRKPLLEDEQIRERGKKKVCGQEFDEDINGSDLY